MNQRSKTGLEILQVAVVIGICGDIFLRATPWGLNVLMFNVVFAGGMILLLWRHAPEYLTRQALALFGALVFFASMFAWRDSIELRIADTLAIVAILSVLFVPRMKIAASVAGVFQYAIAFLWSSLNALFTPAALLAADIEWGQTSSGWRKHAFSTVRGLAIATPLILIFGALFMAADEAYSGWVNAVFNVPPPTLFSHIVIFALFSWLSAGYLRGVLIRSEKETVEPTENPLSIVPEMNESRVEKVRAESGEHAVTLPGNLSVTEHLNISDPPNEKEKTRKAKAETRPVGSVLTEPKTPWQWANIENTILPTGFTLGTVEVGVILGLMNLLFLSFVIVQVPYLFGGMDLVQNTPDLKLADYARRGFGELVAVAALVLPTLLVGHWLIRKGNRFTLNLFRVFAGIQIALLFVIMASAVQRLVLLTGSLGYGMTTVRLYPMIFMIWLGVVFVWFAATVLRGSRQYFAWGALWSAFAILGATHVLNPDEFIVKTNLALMQHGREFDAFYNSHELSDDAIPALINVLPAMSLEDRCEVGSAIHYRYRELGQEVDLRSWNVSRRTAWTLLRANDGLLHQTDGCPEQFHNDR